MLDEVGQKSVVVGGTVDVKDHYVAPSILKGSFKIFTDMPARYP